MKRSHLLIIIPILLIVGGMAWFVSRGMSLSNISSLFAAPNTVEQKEVTATSSPAVVETGTLSLAYRGTELPPISSVTRDAAEQLCSIVYGDYCLWNGAPLTHKTPQSRITITSPNPKAVFQYGPTIPITFTDPTPAGEYHVYLVHHNLLDEIDEVHEARIVSVSGDVTKTLVWDGKEQIVGGWRGIQFEKLPRGHYELVVANATTGAVGNVAPYIQTIDTAANLDKTGLSNIKPYAVGTPLMDYYWDGRGIVFDGNGGQDTIDLTFNRSDIAVFRGVDMPDRNQYQTLVFFRRTDDVVIVTTNVEIFKFGDQTLTIDDLLAQVADGKN